MKKFVHLTNLLVLLLASFIQLGVRSSEVCEAHNFYSLYYPAQNCTTYCCGTCDYRYCCSFYEYRLDQAGCQAVSNCLAYVDYYGYYWPPQSCDYFCCGECDGRYCCSTPSNMIDQTQCAPIPRTTTPKIQYSSSPNIFIWTFGVFGIILVLYGVISCVKYRASRYITAQAVQPIENTPQNTQRNVRQPQPTTVGTNEAYQYDISTIYNTNFQNDLPPSYESVEVQPKTTSSNESNEENKQDTSV